jgi:hypothetical protein
MTRLDISKNGLRAEGGKALAMGLKGNQVMTELNIASNSLTLNAHGNAYDDMSGVTAVANTISGMGAISSINLLKNQIPVEQAQELVKIMQSKENLTTLCGLSREETELDFSSQNLGAGDAVLIANDISDMGALSVLSLKSNALCNIESGKALTDALKGNLVLTELDVSANYDVYNTDSRDGPGFAQELAGGIKDNGAMTSLNLSGNELGAAGARHIANGIKVSNYVVAVVLAAFSCPSAI